MKKFKYRLQKVLEYRTLIKDEKLKELMTKNNAVREVEVFVDELKDQLENTAKVAIANQSDIELASLYRKRVHAQILEAEELLVLRRKEAEEALLEYREAAKDSEALEKLKRNKEEVHHKMVLKEEENFLDEIAVIKGNNLE